MPKNAQRTQSRFEKIEGAVCITKEKGVYREHDVYHKDRILFIRAKGGYVRLIDSGRTSHTSQSFKWEYLSVKHKKSSQPYCIEVVNL